MKTEELEQEVIDLRKSLEPASADDDAAETAHNSAEADGVTRKGRFDSVAVAGTAVVIAGLLATVAGLGWAVIALFGLGSSDDSALAPDKQQVAVDAAGDAAVAILSYKSDTVDADLAAASSLVTGNFGDYYKAFTRDVVGPAAKEKRIDTQATVVGKAISEFSTDHAVVLVFVNQVTTTAEIPAPTTTSTTIRIELERQGDSWLVSKFDPV